MKLNLSTGWPIYILCDYKEDAFEKIASNASIRI